MKYLVRRLLAPLCVSIGVPVALSVPAYAQCPAFGADSTCGTVITVTPTGATAASTGQGPYDGSDDTLVGVNNNSGKLVRALGLTSSQPIFGFDGDGIVTYGAPSNSNPASKGYGGPNAYFTNISTDFKSGVVNFINPISAGSTAYFSLESSLSTAVSCSAIVNNSVTHAAGGGIQMTATFTPRVAGLTTQQAAADCGFTKFNWIQKITNLPDPSPFFAVNPADAANPVHLISTSVPFNDPYQNGYTYNPAWNSYPFYFDPNSTTNPWSLNKWDNGTTLSFQDNPKDPCLPGGNSTGVKGCLGTNAPAGSFVGFTTDLAGILADGTGIDLGVGFSWKTTYTGANGSISTTADLNPDNGSGIGGITITGESPITSYQYGGITITNVAVDVPEPSSMAILALGLCASLSIRRRRRNH